MKIGTTYSVSLDIVYILYLYNNTRVAVLFEQSLCMECLLLSYCYRETFKRYNHSALKTDCYVLLSSPLSNHERHKYQSAYPAYGSSIVLRYAEQRHTLRVKFGRFSSDREQ